MRGRTLNDAFVILDEAQNTTSEQMKMFVTRLGFNSKAVITGDITQIDLPNASRSGLLEAMDMLKNVEGIAFVHFDETDVVRHHLVQRIIRAYDEHKTRRTISNCSAGGLGRQRREREKKESRRLRSSTIRLRRMASATEVEGRVESLGTIHREGHAQSSCSYCSTHRPRPVT